MSLHSDIMNLPFEAPKDVSAYKSEYAAKLGHRDARHASAELAQQADAELARLRAECDNLHNGIHNTQTALTLAQAECERLRVALCAIAEHDADFGTIGWTHWKAMARAALTGALHNRGAQ